MIGIRQRLPAFPSKAILPRTKHSPPSAILISHPHRLLLRNKLPNERGLSLRASSSGLFRGGGAFGSALAASDRAGVLRECLFRGGGVAFALERLERGL